MTMPLKVGVIGMGAMGQTHASNLRGSIPGAILGGIADPRLAEVAGEGGHWSATGYTDYRELLDSDCDAFVIATGSTSHAAVLTAAVAQGKPVFCEKPLALTLQDSVAIHHLYAAQRVPLQMGFMRRFDPHYRRARALIDAGEIGTPYHYYGLSRDRRGPALEVIRYAGGFFLDTGVHEFDLARWLLETEIDSVFARGALYNHPDYRELGDVDQAHVSFHGTSGCLGLVELSRDAVYGYEIRTEVLGTHGAIQVAQVNATGTALMIDGRIVRDTYRDYRDRFRDAYLHEMIAFVDAARHGRTPEVTSVDGIRAVVAAEAARRSLDSHRDEAVQTPV